MSPRKRLVSLDPGFGGFKAAEVRGNDITVYTLPSVVGVGGTDLGMLDLAGVTGRQRRKNLPKRVEFAGTERLVGPNVADYARPVERLDFERLSNGPELRSLTYATLSGLLGTGQADINLAIGLPVEVLQGSLAKDTIRTLQSWLIGDHEFSVNGQAVQFTVHGIRPFAQPLGAFFAWGLGSDGKWSRSTEDLRLPVAVLDLGFNTLDLFSVAQGQISARYTGGDTVGMRRAATNFADNVQAKYNRVISLHEADALMKAYIRGRGEVRLPVAGGAIDAGPLIQSALDYTSGEVVSFVERTWGGGGQFSYLLLTGGGCIALGDRIKRLIPHATLLDDPVTANARGLAKLAQRPGLFGK